MTPRKAQERIEKHPCCFSVTSQPLSAFCSREVKKLTVCQSGNTQETSLPNAVQTSWNSHTLSACTTVFGQQIHRRINTSVCLQHLLPLPIPPGFWAIGTEQTIPFARSGPLTVLQSSAVSPPSLQSADMRSHLSQSSCSSPLTTGVPLLQGFSRPNTVDRGSRMPCSIRIWASHGFAQLHHFIFCLFLDDLFF